MKNTKSTNPRNSLPNQPSTVIEKEIHEVSKETVTSESLKIEVHNITVEIPSITPAIQENQPEVLCTQTAVANIAVSEATNKEIDVQQSAIKKEGQEC